MIPVTKPFIPPLSEYHSYLKGVWERNWLTNNGPLVKELEDRLSDILGINHLLFLGNGTIALQIAIKTLELKGEIITTPFSYVATTSSIVWENCVPKFVDIDRGSFNIDPGLIEAQINDNTSAIMATHVFGNPCEVLEIEAIAKKHDLKVIYDAAHCYGVTYRGKSLLNYGDISTISFHATKLFHTVEGGAVVTNDAEWHKTMQYLRNFGHDGPSKFKNVGINGKNSEFHAAMGLCNLKHIDGIMTQRKVQYNYYLENLDDSKFTFQRITDNCDYNYAYFPILLASNETLLALVKLLNENDIYPRRYFYPSLNSLDYVEDVDLPVSESVAERVLCLPLYHKFTRKEQDSVIKLVNCI